MWIQVIYYKSHSQKIATRRYLWQHSPLSRGSPNLRKVVHYLELNTLKQECKNYSSATPICFGLCSYTFISGNYIRHRYSWRDLPLDQCALDRPENTSALILTVSFSFKSKRIIKYVFLYDRMHGGCISLCQTKASWKASLHCSKFLLKLTLNNGGRGSMTSMGWQKDDTVLYQQSRK